MRLLYQVFYTNTCTASGNRLSGTRVGPSAVGKLHVRQDTDALHIHPPHVPQDKNKISEVLFVHDIERRGVLAPSQNQNFMHRSAQGLDYISTNVLLRVLNLV